MSSAEPTAATVEAEAKAKAEEIAGDYTERQYEYESLRDEIAAALTAAHQRGRTEGLRAGVRIAEAKRQEFADKQIWTDEDAGERGYMMAQFQEIADAITALLSGDEALEGRGNR